MARQGPFTRADLQNLIPRLQGQGRDNLSLEIPVHEEVLSEGPNGAVMRHSS
jgi:hypothetical protein